MEYVDKIKFAQLRLFMVSCRTCLGAGKRGGVGRFQSMNCDSCDGKGVPPIPWSDLIDRQ